MHVATNRRKDVHARIHSVEGGGYAPAVEHSLFRLILPLVPAPVCVCEREGGGWGREGK